MSSFVRLSPRVVLVKGLNPGPFTLDGTNTYLVGTGPGKILVDTGQGVPLYLQNLVAALDGTGAGFISKVLLTHWHVDHTGGLDDVRAMWPALQCHKWLRREAGSPNKLPLYGDALIGWDAPPWVSDILDGEVFSVEGATLEAHRTPGHAADHVSFYLKEEGAGR